VRAGEWAKFMPTTPPPPTFTHVTWLTAVAQSRGLGESGDAAAMAKITTKRRNKQKYI